MSRKHYTLLAQIIRQEVVMRELSHQSIDAERELIRHLCSLLRRDNENFDKQKFVEACGL
jgi:glutamate racemase